jgi:hypothetical protein
MIRKILTIACLLSVVIFAGCQGRNHHHTAAGAADGSNDVKDNPTVIAYYFHRTVRCPGCLEIEASARQVIENSFAKQLEDGKLMWIPFNLDDPGGDEFEKEFDVSMSTLVIAKVHDGNHTKYKKLEKVWDLISDPVKFDSYVKNEVQQFLNE